MKIGIVGSGQFGSGIASLLVKGGHEVSLSDKSEQALKKGIQSIGSMLAQFTQKGLISPSDRELLIHKITESQDIQVHKDADIIIEAVPEKLQQKKEVFSLLEKAARPDAALVTASSSIPVDAIAKAVKTPERVAGLHFIGVYSPVAELVSGKSTSPKTRRLLHNAFGKIFNTVIESDRMPGSSKIIFSMINEAAYCVREGALPENVDEIMKLSSSSQLGPLELADSIGLDVVTDTLNSLRNEDERFKPCPLLVQMAREGKLGRKSGKGFYDYMR